MARPGDLQPLVPFLREYHYDSGATCEELAAIFESVTGIRVCWESISRMLCGDSYAEEPGPVRTKKLVSKCARTLGSERVRQLRLDYWLSDEPVEDLARRYGISRAYTGRVARGSERTDLAMPPEAAAAMQAVERRRRSRGYRERAGLRGERNPNAIFTAAQVDAMRRRYWSEEAAMPAELALDFGTSSANAWMICNNWRWKLPPETFRARYVANSKRIRSLNARRSA